MRVGKSRRESGEDIERLLGDCAKWRRRVWWGPIGFAASYVALFAAAQSLGSAAARPSLILPILAAASLVASLSAMLFASLRGRALARRVAALDDCRALGPLIDSLLIQAEGAHPEVAKALTRLLASATREQATELGEARIRRLRRQLTGRQHVQRMGQTTTAYLCAVIHALAVSGDTQAIPDIESLARRTDDAALRDTAWAAVEELTALRDAQTAQATLLRPADGAAEELLRPADAAADPEVLLRASDGEEQTLASHQPD